MTRRKSNRILGAALVLAVGAGVVGMALWISKKLTYPEDLNKIAAQLAATGTVTFIAAGTDATDPNYGAQDKPGTIAVNAVRAAAASIVPNNSAPRSWYSPSLNVVIINDQLAK